MTRTLHCPKCSFACRFDQVDLVSGAGTDTKTYLQLYCECSNEPVMQFVVDLTPEFDHLQEDQCPVNVNG